MKFSFTKCKFAVRSYKKYYLISLIFFLRIHFKVFCVLFLSSEVVNSFVLQCTYQFEPYFGNLKEPLHEKCYSCFSVVSYECSTAESLVEGVSQNHLEEMKDSDVLFLEMETYSKIDQIPKNVYSFFPNLEVFKCPFCEIKTISSDDLQQFPQLKCIYLGHNQIKTLPGDLFKYTPNVEFVGLEVNKIESFGADFFNFLMQLKIIYFQENVCYTSNYVIPLEKFKTEAIEKCSGSNRFLFQNDSETENIEKSRLVFQEFKPTEISRFDQPKNKQPESKGNKKKFVKATKETADFCDKNYKSDQPWVEKFGITEKPVEIKNENLFETTTQEIEKQTTEKLVEPTSELLEDPTTSKVKKQTTEEPDIVNKDENNNTDENVEPEGFLTKIKKFVEKVVMKIHNLG